MRTARLAAPLLLLALAGCATASGGPEPPVPNTVTQSTEQNGRFIALVGPQRQHSPPFLGVPLTNIYALRSWIDRRSGERVTQLYVEDSYFGAERNYDAARDAAGQKLRFIPISKNEIACDPKCSYAEEFAAELPEPLLRAHMQGLGITFTARSGPNLTVAVPGELVEKQLTALDAARATLPTAAAEPTTTPPR